MNQELEKYDKLIKQAIKDNNIVRYIPTFEKVLKSYHKLLIKDNVLTSTGNNLTAKIKSQFNGIDQNDLTKLEKNILALVSTDNVQTSTGLRLAP